MKNIRSNAQADLNLHWSHMPESAFSDVATQMLLHCNMSCFTSLIYDVITEIYFLMYASTQNIL